MLDFVKNIFQQRHLRDLLHAPREKCIANWDDIKTIGLIFVIGNEEQWNLINRFITSVKKQGKQIHIIGFHPKDYQIDYIFTHTETTICHEKEDFNFFGLPKAGLAENFTDRHFDLLIDATEQPCLFGKIISASSNTDLRVGYTNIDNPDEGNMDMYDLTIQGNDKLDFNDYIEQIVKYLTMIKK